MKLLKLTLTSREEVMSRFTIITVIELRESFTVVYAETVFSREDILDTLYVFAYLLNRCSVSHIPLNQDQGVRYSTPWFAKVPR
jgi:hypothetical protein